jgi:hypothetical protein
VRKLLSATAIAFSGAVVLWGMVFVYVRASDQCLFGYDDQRLIDMAIQYEISAGHRKIDYDHAPDLIDYLSIEGFKEKNKRCCTLDRSHFEKTYVLDRVTGATEVSVDLWYRAANQGPEPFYQSYVVMNACGRVIASHGMSVDRGLTAN